jgi:hypothetical protein
MAENKKVAFDSSPLFAPDICNHADSALSVTNKAAV